MVRGAGVLVFLGLVLSVVYFLVRDIEDDAVAECRIVITMARSRTDTLVVMTTRYSKYAHPCRKYLQEGPR